MFSNNQQPIERYRHLLPSLEQMYEPRGVWYKPINPYDPGMFTEWYPPVYQSGLHAFRHIDSQYLRNGILPAQRLKLKGFITGIQSILNKVYFGRLTKFYVVISKDQEEQFSRFILRFHLINDLQIKLIDPIWYDQADRHSKIDILDLRAVPLVIARKLSRWKKQYSPGFDGLVQQDIVDKLV